LLIPWHEVPPPFEAIRTDRYLYVEYRNGWRELYDLRTDPSELSNLAGHASRRHLAAALARRLHALLS
jgi:arylsulfatase A-like enzyme